MEQLAKMLPGSSDANMLPNALVTRLNPDAKGKSKANKASNVDRTAEDTACHGTGLEALD